MQAQASVDRVIREISEIAREVSAHPVMRAAALSRENPVAAAREVLPTIRPRPSADEILALPAVLSQRAWLQLTDVGRIQVYLARAIHLQSERDIRDQEIAEPWVGLHGYGFVPFRMELIRWTGSHGGRPIERDPASDADDRTPFDETDEQDHFARFTPEFAPPGLLDRLIAEERSAWVDQVLEERGTHRDIEVWALLRDGVGRDEIVALYGETAYNSLALKLKRASERDNMAS
jgi:hypothetical protein